MIEFAFGAPVSSMMATAEPMKMKLTIRDMRWYSAAGSPVALDSGVSDAAADSPVENSSACPPFALG